MNRKKPAQAEPPAHRILVIAKAAEEQAAAIRCGRSDLVELLGMLEESARRAHAVSAALHEVSIASTCMASDLRHIRQRMMLGADDGSADASEPSQ